VIESVLARSGLILIFLFRGEKMSVEKKITIKADIEASLSGMDKVV
jgi:hypothetical protein